MLTTALTFVQPAALSLATALSSHFSTLCLLSRYPVRIAMLGNDIHSSSSILFSSPAPQAHLASLSVHNTRAPSQPLRAVPVSIRPLASNTQPFMTMLPDLHRDGDPAMLQPTPPSQARPTRTKSPSHIKRPLNAFFAWSKMERNAVKSMSLLHVSLLILRCVIDLTLQPGHIRIAYVYIL